VTLGSVSLLRALIRRQHGQTMTEYAVVIAVITAVVVGVFGALSLAVGGKLDAVQNLLSL
jgi:Flp pilus assembly pilin Flp